MGKSSILIQEAVTPLEAPPKQAERIIPLGDRVLIRVQEAASQTDAGLIIPEDQRGMSDRHFRGEVLAVGKKCPDEIAVGMLVSIPANYTGDEVLEANGRRPVLVLISAERVSAIVEKLQTTVSPSTLQ